jgi:hypothetical protein
VKEIVNILYNENYNGIRNIINELSDSVIDLSKAVKGEDIFNNETLYSFLYLINEEYGTCDNIYNALGNKSILNKDILYILDECNKLHDSYKPHIEIAREQIEDYENLYGWNLNDKFLFPCNGDIYVLITISRLMNSEKHIKEFNNEYNRYKHIIENQIYIANDKAINNFYLACIIDINNEFDKNIFTGDFLSNRFLSFRKDTIYTAAFGEAPSYDGKQKRSLNYVYHKYVKKCISISKVTSILTQSRWFQTDSGDLKYLIEFRELIKNSQKVRLLNYYNIISDIENTGGLSYLIIDNNYCGSCYFKKDKLSVDLRVSDIILKSGNYYRLITKLTSGKCLDNIFVTNSWSGVLTNDKRLLNKEEQGTIKVYVSKRYGYVKWLPVNFIKQNTPVGFLKNWKVFFPETISTGKGFNDIFLLAGPCEMCNQTFCGFIVDSEKQGKSLISYLMTEFANKVVLIRKIKNHINGHCLSYLPYIPLDREWTDEKVSEYLKLNEQEKQIIYG